MTEHPPSTSRHWLLIAAFILWLLAAIGVYYLVQKPVSPPILTALATYPWQPFTFSGAALVRTLSDLATAVFLTLVAAGFGLYLLRPLRLPDATSWEQLFIATGAGFGATALLVLALGLAARLTPFNLTLLLTALTLLALTQLPNYQLLSTNHQLPITQLPNHQHPPPTNHPITNYQLPITLYLTLTLLLTLTLALLPPTAWDALFYHLTGPRLYLQAGAIQPGIDLPHLNFPSLMAMLYTLALGVRGDVAAQLLHFAFAPLLAGLVAVVARHHFRLPDGRSAVLFLFAMPMTLGLAAWAYNDLALAFYSLLALHATLRALEVDEPRWLVVAGLAAGLAMSLKYTSFVTPLALAALIFWQKRGHGRHTVRLLAAFALPALAVALPWYLKNLAFTGNPVYPFLFGGPFWNDFRAAAYADAGTGLGFNLRAWLLLPVSLTIGFDFVSGLQDASQDGLTGPLFLAALPLFIFYTVWRRGREAPPAFRPVLFFALAHFLFWFVGVANSASLWQSRLLLPAFVALCPPLAWLVADLARFDHPQLSLRRLLGYALTIVLFLGLIAQLVNWLPAQPWLILAGAESRDAHIARRLGPHAAAITAVNDLPPDAVVTFLWEPRTYYCQPRCQPDSILDALGNLAFVHGDAAAIGDHWRATGVTHLLLWRDGLDFVIASGTPVDAPLTDLSLLDRLIASELTPLTAVAGYELYSVNAP